jgi:hypothetical protein
MTGKFIHRKTRRQTVVGWSEEKFRERVAARAAELGYTTNALFEPLGLAESFRKTPVNGRRLDTLEKIAQACQWSLAELIIESTGFTLFAVNYDLLLEAYLDAQNVVAELPAWAQTDPRVLVRAQAAIYQEFEDYRREGTELDAERRALCRRMLIRAWKTGPDAAENTPTAQSSRSRRE